MLKARLRTSSPKGEFGGLGTGRPKEGTGFRQNTRHPPTLHLEENTSYIENLIVEAEFQDKEWRSTEP